MVFQAKLLYSVRSGDPMDHPGVGGGPNLEGVVVKNIIPTGYSPPIQGEGTLHVFRKYFIQVTDFDDKNEINGLKIFFQNMSNHDHVLIAPTKDRHDAIDTSRSAFHGDLSEVPWTNQIGRGGSKRMPDFRHAHGESNAISIYNNDGIEGGPVRVSNSIDEAVPFWLMYKLDENMTVNPENFSYSFTFGADGGTSGISGFSVTHGIPIQFSGNPNITGAVTINSNNSINLIDEFGSNTLSGLPLEINLSGGSNLDTAKLKIISGDHVFGIGVRRLNFS
jgi:hypothetical protein